jgi:hypothetical protein
MNQAKPAEAAAKIVTATARAPLLCTMPGAAALGDVEGEAAEVAEEVEAERVGVLPGVLAPGVPLLLLVLLLPSATIPPRTPAAPAELLPAELELVVYRSTVLPEVLFHGNSD